MPYERKGAKVYKKENGKLKLITDHKGDVEKAKRHIKALYANVRE